MSRVSDLRECLLARTKQRSSVQNSAIRIGFIGAGQINFGAFQGQKAEVTCLMFLMLADCTDAW